MTSSQTSRDDWRTLLLSVTTYAFFQQSNGACILSHQVGGCSCDLEGLRSLLGFYWEGGRNRLDSFKTRDRPMCSNTARTKYSAYIHTKFSRYHSSGVFYVPSHREHFAKWAPLWPSVQRSKNSIAMMDSADTSTASTSENDNGSGGSGSGGGGSNSYSWGTPVYASLTAVVAVVVVIVFLSFLYRVYVRPRRMRAMMMRNATWSVGGAIARRSRRARASRGGFCSGGSELGSCLSGQG